MDPTSQTDQNIEKSTSRGFQHPKEAPLSRIRFQLPTKINSLNQRPAARRAVDSKMFWSLCSWVVASPSAVYQRAPWKIGCGFGYTRRLGQQSDVVLSRYSPLHVASGWGFSYGFEMLQVLHMFFFHFSPKPDSHLKDQMIPAFFFVPLFCHVLFSSAAHCDPTLIGTVVDGKFCDCPEVHLLGKDRDGVGRRWFLRW